MVGLDWQAYETRRREEAQLEQADNKASDDDGEEVEALVQNRSLEVIFECLIALPKKFPKSSQEVPREFPDFTV